MTTAQNRSHRTFGQRKEPPRLSLVRDGRETHLVLSPGRIAAAAVGLTMLTAGCLGGLGYIAFRDDIIAATLARQVHMQQGYEDRIAALRAQIDRINSRQLIDQEAFEARIDKLMERQDELKRQEAAVAAVLERARASGVRLPSVATPEPAEPVAAPAGKPFRASALSSPAVAGDHAPGREARVEARVAAAEAAVERLAHRRMAAVGALAEMAERDASRIERIVGRLGLKVASAAPVRSDGAIDVVPRAKPGPGVGGPLVPVDPLAVMVRAETAVARLSQARRAAALLPLGLPVKGEAEVTSGFGSRSDPFLGVLAMHTGIDFRAETGDPVVATGPGTVSEAGRQGGYGLMVEIDHGGGISTRFGHLSRIAVPEGALVRRGQVIGYAGSTGRSTGPHVHYETRVNGDAVNPMGWLDAGEELRPVLD